MRDYGMGSSPNLAIVEGLRSIVEARFNLEAIVIGPNNGFYTLRIFCTPKTADTIHTFLRELTANVPQYNLHPTFIP